MVSWLQQPMWEDIVLAFFTSKLVKEILCTGLLQGLPDGTEEEQLYQFEEEMERNSVMLRQYKSSNEQVALSTPPTCLQLSRLTAFGAIANQACACCLRPVILHQLCQLHNIVMIL